MRQSVKAVDLRIQGAQSCIFFESDSRVSISALSVVVGSLGPSMLSDPCCFAFWG